MLLEWPAYTGTAPLVLFLMIRRVYLVLTRRYNMHAIQRNHPKRTGCHWRTQEKILPQIAPGILIFLRAFHLRRSAVLDWQRCLLRLCRQSLITSTFLARKAEVSFMRPRIMSS